MDLKETKLRRINSYHGIIVNVTMDQARIADGSVRLREVVEHPGGVCVLPVDENGDAWCVRQFRYPVQQVLLEAPAGKLEPGEDPVPAAERELGEETGFTAGKLIPLGAYYPSPGFSTECLHLYLALELTRGDAHPDDGELLDLVRIPLSELTAMVMAGEVPDSKTAQLALHAEKLLREMKG